MVNAIDILDQGFACLVDNMGLLMQNISFLLSKEMILITRYGRGNISTN